MKSKFDQITISTFNIQLIPESKEDIDLFFLYDGDDEKQYDKVQAYYNQAVEKKFGAEAFVAFMRPNPDYPNSVLAIIKYPVLVANNNTLSKQ